MLDLLQILGALGVLIPFVWVQLGTLRPTARATWSSTSSAPVCSPRWR